MTCKMRRSLPDRRISPAISPLRSRDLVLRCRVSPLQMEMPPSRLAIEDGRGMCSESEMQGKLGSVRVQRVSFAPHLCQTT